MTISDLQGRWVLESIEGRDVDAESGIFVQIDGRDISGYDGCNHFGGSLDMPAAMRRGQRACADEAERLPLDLSDPLTQLEAGALDGEILELAMPEGDGAFRLRREPGD